MAESKRLIASPATLRLPGHEPTTGRAELVFWPRRARMTRAAVLLLGFWVLVPIVALVPPHLPWALGAFAAGIYFAWSSWTGTHEVKALEGTCPRCGSVLTIKPGTRIRLPHRMNCYTCHHHPQLELPEARV